MPIEWLRPFSAGVPKLLWVATHLYISWVARDPLNEIEYRVLKFAFKFVMEICWLTNTV